jgi:hypothetical protein
MCFIHFPDKVERENRSSFETYGLFVCADIRYITNSFAKKENCQNSYTIAYVVNFMFL